MKNKKAIIQLLMVLFELILFVFSMFGYLYFQAILLSKNISESLFISKYANVNLYQLSTSELDILKFHISESQKYALYSAVLGTILFTYIVSSSNDYIKKYLSTIKEFAKNNIIVFEYLFFGQTIIYLASNNINFYPTYTNTFLFTCSQILNLFSITQIYYPKRMDNTYIKFIVNFILIMISTLIYFSTVYNTN